MNIETYEEIVQIYGEPIFRHRFWQDYDFKGKNDYDLIPTEIIIIRHSNESMGGIMIFTNYNNKNQWHVNDSAGNRFFIREVLIKHGCTFSLRTYPDKLTRFRIRF